MPGTCRSFGLRDGSCRCGVAVSMSMQIFMHDGGQILEDSNVISLQNTEIPSSAYWIRYPFTLPTRVPKAYGEAKSWQVVGKGAIRDGVPITLPFPVTVWMGFAQVTGKNILSKTYILGWCLNWYHQMQWTYRISVVIYKGISSCLASNWCTRSSWKMALLGPRSFHWKKRSAAADGTIWFMLIERPIHIYHLNVIALAYLLL